MTGRRDVYVTSTAIAGMAALAWALPRVTPGSALVAGAAVLVAEAFNTTLREDVRASLSNIVLLVVLLIGGPDLAIVAAVGTLPVIAYQATDPKLVRIAFNWGQLTLAAAAAAQTYAFLHWALGGTFPAWPSLLAVLLAAVAYSVVNHALVAGVVTLSSPDRFMQTFRTIGPSLVMQIPYVGIAVLTAVVIQRASLWALLLMAVPAVIARYGLLAFQRVDEAYDQMVTSVVNALEMKDPYTRGHSDRVSQLSVHVAEQLGVSYEERRLTRYAALLHDVGKIGVPLCIINKPGPLDDDEFAEIKKHPTIGADILHDVDFLGPAIDIVRYHHERLDGRGYPYGVSADELSQLVRIVTAVDAFDAMTSTRSYRRALSVDDAVAELRRCAGRQFDPEVVEALAAVAVRIDWQPTVEFGSVAELHGQEIPVGTAAERLIEPEPSDAEAAR